MSTLVEINKYLKSKIEGAKEDYAIPKRWMPEGYSGKVRLSGRKFFVNPYEFISNIIDDIVSKSDKEKDYTKPLSFLCGEKSSDWINTDIVYGAFVRATAAYVHDQKTLFVPIDEKGYTESGTFLKMIVLLPYFAQYNVNCIYLLPVTQSSDKFKKGEVGSPYSVKDFFKIEKSYHDTLLGNKFSSDQEFAAFVEAAHMAGMRVMLDFVPRTAARDNNLILDHPDWFYWISIDEMNDFAPPKVKELGFVQPSKDNLEVIYNNEEVKRHLKKFDWDPKTKNPVKWENFVRKNRDNPNFLDEIAKEFKVVTVPGFSDWVNDPQPAWEDVTFLRLYLSHPKEALKYIDEKNQPPYVLFDVVKSSLFPGEVKNEQLWNVIADIMPFYQKNFGIDGARLDMGHALPDELEHEIISRVKAYDPSFVIIAEELNMDNHLKAKKNGYDGILGNSWWAEPRIEEGEFKKFISEVTPKLAVLTFATAETPDTPRAVTRKGGEIFSKLTAVVNTFLPNGITFINSGYEIFEPQPMNTGLDVEDPMEERFKNLPPTDQFYGKLAFFDWYVLHWDTSHHMVKLLTLLGELKEKSKNILKNVENFRFIDFTETAFTMFWWDGKNGIIIPINVDFNNPYYFDIDVGYYTWRGSHKVFTKIENYRRGESSWEIHDAHLRVTINPGEARVFFIE